MNELIKQLVAVWAAGILWLMQLFPVQEMPSKFDKAMASLQEKIRLTPIINRVRKGDRENGYQVKDRLDE